MAREGPVQALHIPNLTPHTLPGKHSSLPTAAPPGKSRSVSGSAQGTLQISQLQLCLRSFSPLGAGSKVGAEGPPSFLDKPPF